MPNSLSPRIRQWYRHLDKGQPFHVTAIDDNSRSVEVQHFDGSVEEFSFSEWGQLNIALGAEPASWTGPQDSPDRDLQGDVTDTAARDWDANLREQHTRDRERRPLGQGRGFTEGNGASSLPGEDLLDDVPGARERHRVGSYFRRADGSYLEIFDNVWTAEYAEDTRTRQWRADILRRGSSHWRRTDFASLDDARRAALDFYNDNTGH